MHHAQSLHLRGDATPAEHVERIARTIPARHRLAMAASESANEARFSPRGDADALNAVARTHRTPLAGELLASILLSVAALVRGWRERYRRRVDAQAIHRELAGLDSRTLRDLGIHHRGEVSFVAQRLAHGEDPNELRGQR